MIINEYLVIFKIHYLLWRLKNPQCVLIGDTCPHMLGISYQDKVRLLLIP